MHLPAVKAAALALNMLVTPPACSPVTCSGLYHPVLAPMHAVIGLPASVLDGVGEVFGAVTAPLACRSGSDLVPFCGRPVRRSR